MTCDPYFYLLDEVCGGVADASVPVAESSFVALSIPREWTILYTYPPGMGGQVALVSENSSLSGDFSFFSASMTVFEEDSELSLS